MGCGCRKAKTGRGSNVSQPSAARMTAGAGKNFELRIPGEESLFFATRPEANAAARGKGGATIHRVRQSEAA